MFGIGVFPRALSHVTDCGSGLFGFIVPTPSTVCFPVGGRRAGGFGRGIGGGGGDGSLGWAVFFTIKVVPHLGHRILSPAGGTRRSSTWYGDLQPSHSTLSMALAVVGRDGYGMLGWGGCAVCEWQPDMRMLLFVVGRHCEFGSTCSLCWADSVVGY